ncbi:SpoIIE family protein phosphatase, partial [Paraconexibacter sp.]|uniref:SpoIIE family protein phosphatase n=1 Tax=Paraconexibacter sp. TaxID=2949640 RepID=UPI003564C3CB
PLTDGWLLVIGDVTGKGAAAASVTGMARGAIEAAALETGSAVGAIVRLDGLLARREDQALCSVACVHLHEGPEGMSADIVLAGHPPVLLRRGSEVEPLGTPGPLPGAFPGSSWTAQHVELRDGDVLVLRTDGATDAAGVDGRLGEERLRQTLRELEDVSAQHAVDRVRDVVLEHTDGPQRDDVAVLAVEVGAGARSVHMVLDGSAASVAKARRVVETHLSDELHAETLGRLRLLVSELATNAVKHGGDGSVRLTLGWDATVVRASIVDQGAGFALPIPRTRSARSLDDLAEGGYGLDLLAKMAQRWGVDDEGGTRVWFELDRR